MPITRNDYVIAREGLVVIEFAAGAPGTVPDAGDFDAVGCPKGTWNFNETIAEVDDNIENWCSQAEEAIASFSPGASTLQIDGSMEMILDDDAYIAMRDAARAKQYGWFKITAQNVGSTATEIDTVGGFLTQFNKQFQGTGPADVAISFRANERPGSGS